MAVLKTAEESDTDSDFDIDIVDDNSNDNGDISDSNATIIINSETKKMPLTLVRLSSSLRSYWRTGPIL